jgi:type VI secretion system lysozyme-like protein
VPEPKQPKPVRGARIPLFERLTDLHPNEATETVPLRIYTLDELADSVRREVARLLNTRSLAKDRNGSVLDYGLPDFSWMSAASGDDRRLLADTIARKIAAFEPRLTQVRVTLERDPSDPRRLTGSIHAILFTETLREPVFFPLLMDAKTGLAEVTVVSHAR